MIGTAPGERLRGKALFLSASVPYRFAVETNLYSGPLPAIEELPDQDLRIETAVTALARSVFREGGQLVFGGHPAISPLIAMVAAEYFEPSREFEAAAYDPDARYVEATDERCDPQAAYAEPILTFQSEAYRDDVLADVWLMQRLGQARICWTRAIGGEVFDRSRVGRKQCPKSLEYMRAQMCARENIVAMACIGGMDGVFDELEIFGRSGRAAYVFGSTGGASAVIARRFRQRVRVSDEDVFDAGDTPAYDDAVQRMIDELVPDDGESPLPAPEEPPRTTDERAEDE